MALRDSDIRTPCCGKKVGQRLYGAIELRCPQCKNQVVIIGRDPVMRPHFTMRQLTKA